LTLLPGFPMASGGTGIGSLTSEQLAYGRGRLYVVNDGSDTLSVFAINQATGALTALPFSPISLGVGNWHCAAVHPGGSPVVVGSSGGQIASFNITATTASAAAGSPYSLGGTGSFSCRFSNDGTHVYSGGAFGTHVAGFTVATSGVLSPLPGSPFDLGIPIPLGYATDSANRLFVANYQSGFLTAFTIASGPPAAVAGNPFISELSQAAHGVVHPNGYYMVADRGSNQVGVFRINGTGGGTTLDAVVGSPFATGGFLTDVLSLTRNGGVSRNLAVFSVNGGRGTLSSLGVQAADTLGATGLVTGMVVAQPTTAKGDFDGDVKSDITVFRPSTAGWYVRQSSTNFTTSTGVSWGASTDTVVPGDYDGDGKIDPAVFRPSTGGWYFLKSSTNYTSSGALNWGASTDTVVPGDYDGDGKTDPAVFRPSTAGWFFLKSSTNYTSSGAATWGASTDTVVPADYDGDGKVDPAVFRPSTAGWYILKSSTNYTSSLAFIWGASTDTPINRKP
jgi:hypothetical protein